MRFVGKFSEKCRQCKSQSLHGRTKFALAILPQWAYCKLVIDLKLDVPVTEEVEVDAETLAAINRGIKDANEGRTVSLDEVRKLIPKWISKFESQKQR